MRSRRGVQPAFCDTCGRRRRVPGQIRRQRQPCPGCRQWLCLRCKLQADQHFRAVSREESRRVQRDRFLQSRQGTDRRYPAPSTGPLYWGTVRSVRGSKIDLELRDGRRLNVDLSAIVPRATSEFGAIGTGLSVSGHFDQNGALVADRVMRTPNPSLWGKDRDQ